ncbi:MAG TPA: hypothetical protein DDW90_08145 [Cyanobacteria bacterium UBA9971]|nr:hypothetical protein [Cyanobacteria bacterium UBA9971]HCR36151.1 hypothetical protein [Candidatus Woesebacteria bacterium]
MMGIDEKALDLLANLFNEDEIKSVLLDDIDYTKYQKDPVVFFREILKIKIIPDDLIKIAESVRDNKVTVVKSATGTGKTFCAAALAIWHYRCFPKSQTIAVAAPPENNLKEKLWSEIVEIVVKNRKLFKSDRILNLKITDDINLNSKEDDYGESSGKHFITGKTIPSTGSAEEREAKFSGQHADYLFYENDESDAIPDEVFKGEDGCLSGDGSRQLNMYNPKRQSGYVYELTKGKANVITMSAFNHPNVVSGKNLIPGAVSRDKVVERINSWSRELRDDEEVDKSCFEVPEFLIGVTGEKPSGNNEFYPPLKGGWRVVTNPAFSYKVLGEYPSCTESSLISMVDIDNAVSRWKLYRATYGKDVIKGIKPLLGMDVADEGGDNCCVAKRYGNYIDGFESWKGVDLDKSSDRLSKIYVSLDADQANVEADGIGAAIPPRVGRMWYWRCENNECSHYKTTYLDESIYKCPVCHKEMARCHINARKVYVSSPSQKKCELGKFHLIRDELAWTIADWLKKDPSAMIPDDNDLREEMLAFEYYEDQSSGKIKVSDKKTIKKKIGRSPDKFASLMQCFFEPAIPHIRVI